MRGQLVELFRVKSIHSQPKLGLQQRQRATSGRELSMLQLWCVTFGGGWLQVASQSWGLKTSQGILARTMIDGWQPSPGF